MADYNLSEAAMIDLANIYENGISNFGLEQARRYLTDLEDQFQMLSKHRKMGRDSSEIAPFLRRFSYEAHTIFYMPTDSEIFIVRVLNQSMDYDDHF